MTYREVASSLRESGQLADVVLAREITRVLPIAMLGVMRELSNPVKRLKEILNSGEMRDLVEGGYVTVGMIKPRLDKHMDLDKVEVGFSGDSDLVDHVLNMVDDPLEVLATISLKMTPDMVEEFYAGSKKNMQKPEPDNRSTWEHFHELMASGPVTFLIIGSPEGNAINIWREKIGQSWDVTKSKPGELRHLMKNNRNNGFHGSDSELAVKNELRFITSHL